ncbi:MAG TPA: pyridoxamine 5'-phosphate oxidase family protein [Blastocatellia bacterium]|nr:pyridoxamine 5'-phosphate oxidase family protein [Blastocatellia bacterium]
MIARISDKEARALLKECRTGRLGCIADGSPYVVPVNYILQDDKIYVHSLVGQKVNALRQDSRACLQVDEIVDDYHWRSAIAFGRYREVTQQAERDLVISELLARFPFLTPVESVPVHDGGSSVVVFCIQIGRVSGVADS